MSPTIFRENGFRLFFFSREEPRPHVHVICAEGGAKFWLEPATRLAQNSGLDDRKLRSAESLLRKHEKEIALPGTHTSDAEVTNVSRHGFWLLLGDEELFVPFVAFPWFRSTPVAKLTNVTRPQPHHLCWPDLDIDLAVDSIRDPERFPLVARPAK